ncbi:MAG: hypothetical protein II309_04120 [Bacilli bacterium]|jgi:hypothetical protein|nr:hypothetical protein [Bacilli bacterium]
MEEQKNYEKKYIWYNRSRYSENVGLINACKIGILNKHNYVVHLSRVNGKEVLVVHSLIEKEGDIIEKLEDELARKLFNRLMFY